MNISTIVFTGSTLQEPVVD